MSEVKELKFTKVRGVKSPSRGTPESVGFDLSVPFDLDRLTMNKMISMTKCDIRVDTHPTNGYVTNIVLKPGQEVLVPTGIKVRFPKGYFGKIENRSSIASVKSLVVGSCIIDPDYQGEVLVNLHNVSDCKMAVLCPGDKMCQLVIYPFTKAEAVEIETAVDLYKGMDSEREEGGFGSTGIQ